MAVTVKFDLVSPERKLASVDAREVQIPGAEGDMTAMAGHAPTITTLRPGLLRVVHAGGTDEYIVSGGFADIAAATVSVLAEEALPKAELTQDGLNRLIDSVRAVAAGPDAAAKAVADLNQAARALGLSV